MKYFDQHNKRLVYLKEKTDARFWDKHWEKHGGVELVIASLAANTRFYLKTPEKYLHKGARIALVGTLDEQRWETNEGQQRTSFQLIANSLEFIKTDGRGFEESENMHEQLPF